MKLRLASERAVPEAADVSPRLLGFALARAMNEGGRGSGAMLVSWRA